MKKDKRKNIKRWIKKVTGIIKPKKVVKLNSYTHSNLLIFG